MNPYLEQPAVWHDFHERFCTVTAEMITMQVRLRYIVKIDERVYVHELPEGSLRFLGRADVGVKPVEGIEARSGGTLMLAAPASVRLPAVDLERLSFVEIRDRDADRVVTVIELLEPGEQATRSQPRTISWQAGRVAQ